MKKILYMSMIGMLLLASCKKDKIQEKPLSTLTVFNATTDVPVFLAEIDKNPATSRIGYYDSNNVIVDPGSHEISVYPENDKSKIANIGDVNFKAGELWSLFIFGPINNLENRLVKEKAFQIYEKNQCGVRFMNVSAGSQPLNVELVEASNEVQFSNVAYGELSAFKVYNTMPDQLFTFEVRKVSDNSLVTSFITTLPLHQNMTLAITGSESSQNIVVFPFNHFRYN